MGFYLLSFVNAKDLPDFYPPFTVTYIKVKICVCSLYKSTIFAWFAWHITYVRFRKGENFWLFYKFPTSSLSFFFQPHTIMQIFYASLIFSIFKCIFFLSFRTLEKETAEELKKEWQYWNTRLSCLIYLISMLNFIKHLHFVFISQLGGSALLSFSCA